MRPSIYGLRAILFTLLVILTAGIGFASGQCETTTDEQLVATIYDKIKADKELVNQVSHINVVGVNRAIKFQGWADTKKDYEKVVDFAMTTACVRVVNVNDFSQSPPAEDSNMRAARGCAPGTKPCGDICIPEGDICNIGAAQKSSIFLPADRPFWLTSGGETSIITGCF